MLCQCGEVNFDSQRCAVYDFITLRGIKGVLQSLAPHLHSAHTHSCHVVRSLNVPYLFVKE